MALFSVLSARSRIDSRGPVRDAGLLPAALAAIGAWLLLTPAPAAAQYADKALDQCESGVRAADAGRWEEAEFRWLKAVAIDATVPCGHNNLAVMRERKGDYDEADEYYRMALETATGEVRSTILDNFRNFRAARTAEAVEGVPESEFGTSGPDDRRQGRTQVVTISVPEAGGRDLADFRRVLVGPFIVTTPDTPVPVGPRTVAYFRRRIVQRSFLQTVDVSTSLPPGVSDPLHDASIWKDMAERVGADLIFSGRIGLQTSNSSRVVEEQIRAPSGEVRKVARFREMIKYEVSLHYALLRGDEGTILQEGDLSGSREFAADDEIPADDMLVETLEELLPQVLDLLTPRRVEQTRVLIF